MAEIFFRPFEKTVRTDGPRNLLQLARRIGVPIQSACGGKGICGKCRVVVEKSARPLPPPSRREKEALGRTLIRQGYRLACETVLTHDATIRIPRESRVRPQVILTSGADYPYPTRLQPEVENYPVEVPRPVIQSIKADRERLLVALETTYGLKRLNADPLVLRKLPGALRSGSKGITAAIWKKREIIDIYAGKRDRIFGMAFDIGTTTVVGYLMDLSSGKSLSVQSDMNPQIPYGDDVITRISFVQEKAGHLEQLRADMIGCINSLIARAASEAGIDPAEILELTVVGNTAMHHLFLGMDPAYLAQAPYPPVLSAAQDFKARDLGIRIGASAYVHMLPVKAGFVGSDAIAGVLATGLPRKKKLVLLIDLGTNGEIVLGNKDRMISCSTAAGPAFEGGHIRWGMRAAAGAIERVRIHPETYEVTVQTIHDEPPVGICGSGIISAVAEMIRAGIILERGNFNEKIRSPRLRRGENGLEFVLVWGGVSAVGQDIVVSRKDVAELQMAKSAIYAGATLLMGIFGAERIHRILLAGAGGNHVDPLDAGTIDLFPGCDTAQVSGVGNAAGHGACLALLDRSKRKEAIRIAEKMVYQELAASPRFQDLFVESMFFTKARDDADSY